MSTKPPSQVLPFPDNSLEKIAYASVEKISTQEPNDQNRLAYHVWRWLKSRQGTLDNVLQESGVRLTGNRDEALKSIREGLAKHGITF